MQLAIFGAQGYALGAYEALRGLYPRCIVPFFIVSKIGNNAPELGGVPVKELAVVSSEMSKEDKQNLEIVIATPENVQPEIEETLENYGFRRYSRLDSERWGELMKMFHIKLDRFLPLSALPVGYNKPFTRIFMAKSHKDRPLKNPPVLPEYVYPIQAGAAMDDIRVADITDNKGETSQRKMLIILNFPHCIGYGRINFVRLGLLRVKIDSIMDWLNIGGCLYFQTMIF